MCANKLLILDNHSLSGNYVCTKWNTHRKKVAYEAAD